MRSGSKTFVFIGLTIIFLVGAPLLVLHSQGYRLDVDNLRLTKTGGLFIKAAPKPVTVQVGPTVTQRTDRLFGSALISDLLPGQYRIVVSKEGYTQWQKTLPVREMLVTEARHVRLFPDPLSFATLTSSIDAAFMGPDAKRAILVEQEQKPVISLQNATSTATSTDNATSTVPETSPESDTGEHVQTTLSLYNFQRDVKSFLASGADFSGGTGALTILSTQWHPDGTRAIVQAARGETVQYYRLTLSPSQHITRLSSLPPRATEVTFNPAENRSLFVTTSATGTTPTADIPLSRLKEVSIGDSTASPSTQITAMVDSAIGEDTLYWISPEGHLLAQQLTGSNKRQLTDTQVSLKSGERHRELTVAQGRVTFREGETLYVFDKKAEQFEGMGSSTSQLAVSPAGSRAAFIEDSNTIRTYFFESQTTQPERSAGDTFTLASFDAEVHHLSWLTEHYLIAHSGEAVYIIETDTRDHAQRWRIATVPPESTLSISTQSGRIYALIENAFKATPSLISTSQ